MDTSRSVEDLTDGRRFSWGEYLLSFPGPMQGVVLGPGVTEFHIKRISWILRASIIEVIEVVDLELADYFVTRSDGSQVRLHPYENSFVSIVYVDRPRPDVLRPSRPAGPVARWLLGRASGRVHLPPVPRPSS